MTSLSRLESLQKTVRVPAKVTTTYLDQGYVLGDLYAEGLDKSATETGVKLFLMDPTIDVSTGQTVTVEPETSTISLIYSEIRVVTITAVNTQTVTCKYFPVPSDTSIFEENITASILDDPASVSDYSVDDQVLIGKLSNSFSTTDGNAFWAILGAGGSTQVGNIFAVNLTENSGSNGNQTSTPSWTYDITDLNGNSLGTDLTPKKQRRNGYFVSGDGKIGLAYYDETDTIQLFDANEVEQTRNTC